MPVNTSPRRRPSRTASRRSKILPTLPSKVRPGLAVDTSVSRHRAPAPQQVFPPESKPQELSFISLADIKALKKQKSAQQQGQRQLQDCKPQGVQRSFSDDKVKQTSSQDVPPPYVRSKTTDHAQQSALHKRIKGLRPSPLDLSTDVSPSDRAITIGISLDPNTVPRHSRTPSSPQAAQLYPSAQPQRRPSEKYNGQEVVTPTIVITPAKEDFDLNVLSQASDHLGHQPTRHRPSSSIYSRHTNCIPMKGYTPPVPPLPLFATGPTSRGLGPTGTLCEGEAGSLKVPKRSRNNNLSVCTVFEEDKQPVRAARRLTSQSLLPTPRRSRGWWNLITSPFSASSRSNAFFWQSPTREEDGDRIRMLDDDSEMHGADEHAGVIFTNRGLDDLDLRSAPPVDSGRHSFNAGRPRQPKRSDTAPGALDMNGRVGVNIYSVPYVGAAADYYNPHKNFPSVVIMPEAEEMDRGLGGWSPSQSVYRASRGSVEGAIVNADDDSDSDVTAIDDENPFDDHQGASRALEDEKSPFSDAHASNAFEGFSGTYPAATANKTFFSTPPTEELRGASLDQPGRPEPTRNGTQGTLGSCFSPDTATPVIEHAKMGTLMGPSVVDVTTTRTATPQSSGLGHGTMASRGVGDERAVSEKAPFRHQRNDSYGLGIDTKSESMSEKSLFPPPKPLAQQPRLGTDRFGQLRIEQPSDRDEDRKSWYRRLLWPLLSLAAAMLILFIVLLAIFVSQGHDDMPVQAQWLNLTGFPAMPTGVATVIQPTKNLDVGGCVQPADLWSCAAPDAGAEFDNDAPDFRFEIRFRNQTREDINSTNLTPASSRLYGSYRRSVSGAASGNALSRRSAWSDSLFASLPSPPSQEEMIFLGNTTDDISEPYEGEETPFYLSLLNASALAETPPARMRLAKRERGDGVYPYPSSSSDSPPNDNTTDTGSGAADTTAASTHAASEIPRPFLSPNGQPAPPQLYPLAHAQPLRLFDRGRPTEHYGFSTYFDRSVHAHLPVSAIVDGTNSTLRARGGAAATTTSNALCVFAQTRFHVQIWTRRGSVGAFHSGNGTENAVPAADSTANALLAPGSFPYPVTVTLDRHGGRADQKGVYCHGVDPEGRVVREAGTWVEEDRGSGGSRLVNPADVPGGDGGGVEVEDAGGIDGGEGGCGCSWRNWGGE